MYAASAARMWVSWSAAMHSYRLRGAVEAEEAVEDEDDFMVCFVVFVVRGGYIAIHDIKNIINVVITL